MTQGGFPELLIDQTVGLEPKYLIAQLKPRDFLPDPIQLEPISLSEFALDDRDYKNALLLAKGGLWSPALKLMQSVKAKVGDWPTLAQTQLELIQLHAKITQGQAQASWSSSSQKILADLFDGQWSVALQAFTKALDEGNSELANFLKNDPGRVMKRVEVALRVDSSQMEIKAWGAIMLAAQQGQSVAIAWLQKQPKNTPQTNDRIQDLLDQLEFAFVDLQTANRSMSKIVGSGSIIGGINPDDWLRPKKSELLKLEGRQVWYLIEVSNFADGKRWLKAPFTELSIPKISPGRILWKLLGLDKDAELQLTNWTVDGQPQTTSATVKAIRLLNGSLELLASGEAIAQPPHLSLTQSRLFGMTTSALKWLEPDTATIIGLSQQQPELIKVILPILWQELQASGQLPPGPTPLWEDIFQRIGYLAVLPIGLTGEKSADLAITLRTEDLITLRNPFNRSSGNDALSGRRTVIFSATGKLLYSEFTTDSGRSLTGFADLEDGKLPALVIAGSDNYRLLRWSSAHSQFE